MFKQRRTLEVHAHKACKIRILEGMYGRVILTLRMSPLVCTGIKVQFWTRSEPELLQITSTFTAMCTIL